MGAISGAIIGGSSKVITLHNASEAAKVVSDVVPSYSEAELLALEEYGGRGQVSFLAGEEVSSATLGSTKPDIVRFVDGHLPPPTPQLAHSQH